MAVEIKQIVIRAVLTEAEKSEKSQASEIEKDAFLQECVDQVVNILKKKNRR